MDEEQELPTMSTRIRCQVTGCDYVAEHTSENVAIALLTSHGQNHKKSKQKAQIDRPECKQDISIEEWQEFESDWSRFKRSHDVDDDVANQLFHCCVIPLRSLLIKENPNIIHEGEEALLNAMKQMAVLHVATSVRRANLLSTKQESGQTFRQFYANVRAAASTCGFSVRCPQTCCSLRQQNGQPAPHPPVDYSPMVIKDILIAGIEDQEILKDVLGMADLDTKTDKDIVKFVEEKEIARNALASSGSANALSGSNKSSYRKTIPPQAEAENKKKLALKGKCADCQKEIHLYKKYASGKLNKDAFKVCNGCYRKTKPSDSKKENNNEPGEASAVFSFIGALNVEEDTASSHAMGIARHDKPNEEGFELAHLPVKIALSNHALSKFRRCSEVELCPVGVLAKSGSHIKECLVGEDVLQKLKCSRAQIVKGRIFVKLESGGVVIEKMIKVIESANGLLLDARTVADLQGQDTGSCPLDAGHETCANSSYVVLNHHIFTPSGWSRVSKLSHPKLRVRIHTDPADYDQLNAVQPTIVPKYIDVVADSGAQSCLWSRSEFLRSGFSMKDLVPVRHVMKAANCAEITIDGAILLRLSGMTQDGSNYEAAVMVYISPNVKSLFLSKEVMIQLGIIAPSFPQIGATGQLSPTSVNTAEVIYSDTAETADGRIHKKADLEFKHESNSSSVTACGCLRREPPPGKPDRLPFPASMENVKAMRDYILERWGASTFNQCPHQALPIMDGPPMSLHVQQDAKPVRAFTPAPVALHFQEEVKAGLDSDVEMGVLERVPYGEVPEWVSRMVIARKADGRARRVVDMSPLNRFCSRETHPMKSPFHLARSVPRGSIKTVLDAWNGYHSVVLREEDRHFTTFITPWGLYRYKRAPQGFLSSGDGFNRRLDDILSGFQRLIRCVDDSLLHDPEESLEEHWWRVMEFLEVAGHAGIVLNPSKFQFSQVDADFAGFRITEDTVEPLPKYLEAILNYPTPQNITDIRSWFGLVNQVAHYAKLCDMMEPFRSFLSPKVPFEWNSELDRAFEESKKSIVKAIREGVQIFDPTRRTALMTDWSKTGVGFWLLQKHCECTSTSPGCCKDGWRITLAGSRFLSKSEKNYAPIEGEALAVAWSLEQTRFFTMGCDNLLVVVDHKPLVKILGDRGLDEIDSPRLFRLKLRTLMWKFSVEYQPGIHNYFADAVSRHPTSPSQEEEDNEELIVSSIAADMHQFSAVTWDMVHSESAKDPAICMLAKCVKDGFPSKKCEMSPEISEFWEYRHGLSLSDVVVLYNDRIVVPAKLRAKVLVNLHSAHQGITGMSLRALSAIFWPGITSDIDASRNRCRTCHQNAPTQPRLPPKQPELPTAPFEQVCADFFKLSGHYYLVLVDRLSGWPEVVQIKQGTSFAGAKSLCRALRGFFATFGVPEEIATDGGPEFVAQETKDFYMRWGVKHRLSSAYHPQSNGRAELAVKSIKRLLEKNVTNTGDLNTDEVVCALLQFRNTPDRDCNLSPAQVLFGRQLRDGIPQLKRSVMIFQNNQILDEWHDHWKSKENALRSRLIKNCERLEANTKNLDPLREGDVVLVQNQIPNSPRSKKWDRQGTVVFTGENDQYLIKVTGTGRLTLRNRHFLRKFQQIYPS